MREFCLKHGEGKKWYLEARNYSEDLASDVSRQLVITEFFEHPEVAGKFIEKTERLQALPKFVRDWFMYLITRRQKKIHYGQVVPIEDVEKIFNLTNSMRARRLLLPLQHAGQGEALLLRNQFVAGLQHCRDRVRTR